MRAGETFSTLYSVDETSSFELHARSFESSRLIIIIIIIIIIMIIIIIIIITYLTRVNPSAEAVINLYSGQLKN